MTPIKNALRAGRRKILEIAAKEYLRVNTSKAITTGPLTWDHHGVAARTSTDWMREPKWAIAHDESWAELEALGLTYWKRDRPIPIRRENFHNEWNIHVAAWAAKCGLNLEGDFVEIGVGAGIFSRCIMRYLDFDQTSKTFWLVDRWSGDSVDHLTTASEKLRGVSSFIEDFPLAQRLFAPYRNARLVRGMVPDVLPQVGAAKIAFLYIDLNSATPELAALDYLWPRLTTGAVVVSDDFGFPGHEPQLIAFKQFCADHGMPLLYSPTGQGIAIRV